jgi:hypothetical protein
MKITTAVLESLDACCEQAELFASTFPDGLTVSGEPDDATIARIVAAGLGVEWLAGRVLTAPALATHEAACATALATYEAARDSAWATYRAACAFAWATHEAACDSALATYRAACAPAGATHRAACDSAWATYEAATVGALWRLLTDPANIRADVCGIIGG